MTKTINDLMRIGLYALKCINDTKSDCCKEAFGPILELLQICNDCLSSSEATNPYNRMLLNYFDDIEDCLKTCGILCQRVSSKIENYFGVFEVNIIIYSRLYFSSLWWLKESLYRVEISSLVSYLNFLLNVLVIMAEVAQRIRYILYEWICTVYLT